MFALCNGFCAPGIFNGPLMRELVFHSCQFCRIIIRVQLCHFLVSQYIPMITRADGYARTLGCFTRPAFGDGIGYAPQVRCDLRFNPVARIIIPFMTTTYPHAGVLLTVICFIFIVRRAALRNNLPGCISRGAFCFHCGGHRSAFTGKQIK